ncbi:unnamed protein product [Didymodactylos carnosus]|uniref:Uncharacterized protein n=1 Tax=Didymodactylos carnosus TaxID=1234261 RepID=A0A816DYS2_9BILA|nr:unnamed protein product [Didymodactylos carnosus]CAF1642075.1 unnamed protein product [Didymodactylos carnosus]CAF4151193.1 unnamed protein product [Didymodactylos carnosus]CAF4555311.1 unnamed protein product [Didymodactylos carnosus]
MQMVDAFVCFHPASMCELYMPFNKSLLVIASTRYELARLESYKWQKWNENLKMIARNPQNVVGANNLYDAEYIRYFTGLKVTLLPSLCNYTNAQYKPVRKSFLFVPIGNTEIDKTFPSAVSRENMTIPVNKLREVYSRYKYSDLSSHLGIIHVPYQLSTMSIFEQYRMNIPLFFPALDLLTEWHKKQNILCQRTWHCAYHWTRANGSVIRGVEKDMPDPNNDYDIAAVKYWLKFADFYQWPHIILYESIEDLIQKLETTDLMAVSAKMKTYNEDVKLDLLNKWNGILKRIKEH